MMRISMMKTTRTTTRTSFLSCSWLLGILLLLLSQGGTKAADETKTETTTTTTTTATATDTSKDGSNDNKPCDAGDETCKVRIVYEEELATKKGEEGGTGEIWLSIFGQVYDVSKGPQYYAPKAGYHIFAGRDGTIPFITGNFTEAECAKHSDELTAAQLYALDHDWAQFYAKEEKYPFVGFLCCRFYDGEGQPTEETIRIKQRVRGYEKIKAAKDKERKENRRKMMMTMTGAGTPKQKS